MHRLDISPSPPGLVVPVPGLQGVVHLPAGPGVEPAEADRVGALADAQVVLRGGEHEVGGDVLYADTRQPRLTAFRPQLSLSRPGLTHRYIYGDKSKNDVVHIWHI